MNNEIIKKIRSLLAKSASTSNVHEAEIFAAKAHELLAKHNLSLADMAEEEAPDRECWKTPSAVPDPWARQVWSCVAHAYFCKPIESTYGRTKTIKLIGAPHNISVAVEMAKYLIKTVRRLAREHSHLAPHQRQFCNGASGQLAYRLQELRRAKQETPHGTGTTLPAVYDMEQRLNDEYVNKMFGELGKARAWNPKKSASYLTGANAAAKIGLDTQVSHEQSACLLTKS